MHLKNKDNKFVLLITYLYYRSRNLSFRNTNKYIAEVK